MHLDLTRTDNTVLNNLKAQVRNITKMKQNPIMLITFPETNFPFFKWTKYIWGTIKIQFEEVLLKL